MEEPEGQARRKAGGDAAVHHGGRLVGVADIHGEHDLLHHVFLMAPHLNRRGSQKMAGIRKADGNIVIELDLLPVDYGMEQGINRFENADLPVACGDRPENIF